MSEQEYLIDWLHKVESDPANARKVSKRLPSIISELYFEHRLSIRQDLGLHTPLSFGWTVHFDRRSESRHWFKISERNEGELSGKKEADHRSLTNKAFIAAIAAANSNDRFFVVMHEVKMDDENKPSLNWKILEVEIILGFMRQREDQIYANDLGRRVAELVTHHADVLRKRTV